MSFISPEIVSILGYMAAIAVVLILALIGFSSMKGTDQVLLVQTEPQPLDILLLVILLVGLTVASHFVEKRREEKEEEETVEETQ